MRRRVDNFRQIGGKGTNCEIIHFLVGGEEMGEIVGISNWDGEMENPTGILGFCLMFFSFFLLS